MAIDLTAPRTTVTWNHDTDPCVTHHFDGAPDLGTRHTPLSPAIHDTTSALVQRLAAIVPTQTYLTPSGAVQVPGTLLWLMVRDTVSLAADEQGNVAHSAGARIHAFVQYAIAGGVQNIEWNPDLTPAEAAWFGSLHQNAHAAFGL